MKAHGLKNVNMIGDLRFLLECTRGGFYFSDFVTSLVCWKGCIEAEDEIFNIGQPDNLDTRSVFRQRNSLSMKFP